MCISDKAWMKKLQVTGKPAWILLKKRSYCWWPISSARCCASSQIGFYILKLLISVNDRNLCQNQRRITSRTDCSRCVRIEYHCLKQFLASSPTFLLIWTSFRVSSDWVPGETVSICRRERGKWAEVGWPLCGNKSHLNWPASEDIAWHKSSFSVCQIAQLLNSLL